jgi:hypothetical protein
MSFFRNLNLVAPATLAFALVGAPALAQDDASSEDDDALMEALEEEMGPPSVPRLDVGLATGFNSPSGTLGLETHVRLNDYVGVGVVGGVGAWGPRITPQVRLYPMSISTAGLFLEGGLSLNLGTDNYTGVDSTDGAIIQELTPTVTTGLGYRFPFMDNKAWGLLRLGYAFRLRQDNIRLGDGSPVPSGVDLVLEFSQHQGLLIGAGFGLAFF